MNDSKNEEDKRRDEVLKRMLNTKPQPHKTKQGEKLKGEKPAKGKKNEPSDE
ncbi:hypothetical protein [Microvirga calopogonii]|uniref:hypothetical protein n=1 Tax=Microvirga calopogonii TaxID=2078013 RepID=UPI0013B3988A|nr:hypothetical protein [Microvirga calopogonii]